MIYVCSDIHGQYQKFRLLLKKINFSSNDEMYILGDIIDRGPNPIDLLFEVMTTPNIHLLLGNHEHMMIQAYQTGDFALWLHNGAQSTIKQFERMPARSQKIILHQLSQLPLVIPNLTVGDKHYYLTHTGIYNHIIDKPLLYADITKAEQEEIVWDRRLAGGFHASDIVSSDVYEHYRGHRILFGHTVTSQCMFGSSRGTRTPHIAFGTHSHKVNLDCGAGYGGKLGCLRLDDFHEFYVV